MKPKYLTGNSVALAVAAAAAITSTAPATTVVWTGAADTANWQTPNNWSTITSLPGASDTAEFTNTGTYFSNTINPAANFSLGELQFGTATAGSSTPAAITLKTGFTLTLTGATGVDVDAGQAKTVTINSGLSLSPSIGTSTTFNITQATTLGGVVSGSGNFIKTGNAALTLSPSGSGNTYTGTTTIEQNNIVLNTDAPSGSPGALGNSTSAVQIGDATTTGTKGAGLATNAAVTVGRDIVVYPIKGTAGITLGGSVQTAKSSIYSGQVTLNGPATLESYTTGSNVVEFSGPITGPGGLTKGQAGVVQLDAVNNYAGNTTVAAGTLLVNGFNTGGGSYAVNAGTLGGSGWITTGAGSNGITVASGAATLAPGLLAAGPVSGASMNVFGDVAVNGALSIEADSNTSQINISGTLTLGPNSTLIFTGDSTGLSTDNSYVIASYGVGVNGTFGSIVNAPAGFGLDYNYLGQDEIALVQGASPAPEPAAIGMLGIVSIGLLSSRRSRRRSARASTTTNVHYSGRANRRAK